MMQTHIIEDMVRKLRPVLKDSSRAKTILTRYWRSRMALIWSVRDVHTAANEKELALTDKEAMDVLQTIHLQHNKQYGIRWEDLTNHIEEHCLGRKLTKAEIRRFVEKNVITIHQ